MVVLLPWILRLAFGLVGGYLAGGLFAKLSLGSTGNAVAGAIGAVGFTTVLVAIGLLPTPGESLDLAAVLLTAGTSGLAGVAGAAVCGLARRLIAPPQPLSIL